MKRRFRFVLITAIVLLMAMLIVVWFVLRNQGIRLFTPAIDAPIAATSVPLETPVVTATTVPADSPEPTPQATKVAEQDTPEPSNATPTAYPTRVVSLPSLVTLPPGFGISVYTDQLAGPRMMTLSPEGDLVVAERSANRIVRLPDRDHDGVADGVEVLAEGLSSPSSIAYFEDGSLYVGETTRILRLNAPDDQGRFQEQQIIIEGLPSGGHDTRTVLFSADWQYLYVSVGSSCNVCDELDPRRATVMRYRPDGSEETFFTVGMRNAVGLTLHPEDQSVWVTNNGRDWLGDDQPPETVYRISAGDDAGWPRCHSARIIDPDFGFAGACDGVLIPEVEMQAHSAPLGLTFYTGEQFPVEYQSDLFVAFHGSWNREEPTGYKVVRVDYGEDAQGAVMDFASGWLRDDGSRWARPVDVITGPDGSLYISDDYGGYIFRIFYKMP